MDLLAALKAEVSSKRKQEQRNESLAGTSGARPAKRWRPRAEMEEEKRKDYLEQQRKLDEQRKRESERKWRERRIDQGQPIDRSPPLEQLSATGSTLENTGQSQTRPDNHSNPSQQTGLSENPPLSKVEVVIRLRNLKEPATLFGESPWDRFNRMRDLQLAREEVSKGQRNVFQKKMREMEAKDAEDDLYKYTGAQLPQFGSTTAAEKSDDDENADQTETPSCKEDYVHQQLRKYMRLWASEIDSMSKEQRRTNKGRSLAVTYEQTKDWLKPLYKLLRKRKLAKNILDALKCIFEAANEREYVQANSLYLERLAIGNAPWPMGATMVGIHARAAREKIGEDKIAHVMNDEQTRKYIQAVKRLLTVAQRYFPTSYSKMIL